MDILHFYLSSIVAPALPDCHGLLDCQTIAMDLRG